MNLLTISNIFVLFTIHVIFIPNCGVNGNPDEDFYTSVIGIRRLPYVEHLFVKRILEYQKSLNNRQELIQRYLEEYQRGLQIISESKYASISLLQKIQKVKNQTVSVFENDTDTDMDLMGLIISENPILSFKIFSRFAKELTDLLVDFETEIETDLVHFLDKYTEILRVPNQEDISGAADGLHRIHETYDIPIQDFIRGKYGGDFLNDSSIDILTSYDLHYIGTRALNCSFFVNGIQWMFQAYRKALKDNDPSLSLEIIQSSLVNAIEKHNEGLKTTTENEINAKYFQIPLDPNVTSWSEMPLIHNENDPAFRINYTKESIDDLVNFMALCKGTVLQTPSEKKSLHCYYKRDTPYSIINPMKVEILHESPSVLQFYDILSPSVTSRIISKATPHLHRSHVLGSVDDDSKGGKKSVKSEVRTSAVTWITEENDEIIKTILKIIEDATALDITTFGSSEELQISSYGPVGGHYSPHLDAYFHQVEGPQLSPEDKFRGDRTATIMFYLSDVLYGGSTAFPRMGIAARPVKGSAVFWYNLKRNGDVDPLTLHGGCPVAFGNKWVANKWIRSYGQMLNRPCSVYAHE